VVVAARRATLPPMERAPGPEGTALLLIECQRGVVGDLSVLPDLAALTRPVLPRIGALATAARAAGVTVAHLTYAPMPGGRSTSRRSPLTSATAATADWGPERPGAEVVAEVGVGPDDLVFERHQGISPVHRTEVLTVLRNMGIEGVVVAGVSTNLAVPLVAVAAADEDFAVTIVRDATAGVPASHHESVLRYSLAFVGRLASADELMEEWRAAAGT
jgi:nicotinamidase-related amidase